MGSGFIFHVFAEGYFPSQMASEQFSPLFSPHAKLLHVRDVNVGWYGLISQSLPTVP